MNSNTGWPPGADALTLRRRSQITRTGERIVFIDEGSIGAGSYGVAYIAGQWYDYPPMRHGQGTTFSFVDNHAEYRKWTDKHTLDAWNWPWGSQPPDNSDCDLRWLVKRTWGKVGYTNPSTTKKCEY